MLTNYHNTIHEMVNWSHEQSKMRVDTDVSKSALERREGRERGASSTFFG